MEFQFFIKLANLNWDQIAGRRVARDCSRFAMLQTATVKERWPGVIALARETRIMIRLCFALMAVTVASLQATELDLTRAVIVRSNAQ